MNGYFWPPENNSRSSKFRLVTRDEWGARDPQWVKFLSLPVKNVFFEYTYTEECHNMNYCIEVVQSVQKYNLKLRGNPDIRYNFLISPDGTVFEGRGWESAPRLPQKWRLLHKSSYYIALIGSYVDHSPSEDMFQSRSNLILYGVKRHYIRERHLEYSISLKENDKEENSNITPRFSGPPE